MICYEGLREAHGVHTPDKRRSRHELGMAWPNVEFDSSVTENDELWSPKTRETLNDVGRRINTFFAWLHARPEKKIVIVTHGVWIECALRKHVPAALAGGARVQNCEVYRAESIGMEGNDKLRITKAQVMASLAKSEYERW
jgi:broad specificity phosphatase PhoE